MKGTSTDISLRKTARLAGLLFLLTTITGSFGLFIVRSKFVMFGNVTETAHNIMSNELLFRVGNFSTILAQIFYLFVGITLFSLFKGVNKKLSTILLMFFIIVVILTVMNTLTNFGALLVLSKADYLKVFEQDELNTFMMLFLRLNNFGQCILEIFWTPLYFTLGLLIIKSKYLPRILGILFMVASFTFLLNTFTILVIPIYYLPIFTKLAMTFGGLSVLPTIFWLIVKGIKIQQVD